MSTHAFFDIINTEPYTIILAHPGYIQPAMTIYSPQVSICIKELLPTAMRYDPKDAIVTYSVVVGMAIMALSLVLFALASPEDDDE